MALVLNKLAKRNTTSGLIIISADMDDKREPVVQRPIHRTIPQDSQNPPKRINYTTTQRITKKTQAKRKNTQQDEKEKETMRDVGASPTW